MTSKDLNLNLSFDQLPSAQAKHKRVPPPLQQVKNRPAAGSTDTTIKMPERNIPRKTTESRSSPLVVLVLVLMVVNILVLGAAGYWLSAHFGQPPAQLGLLPPAADPGPEFAALEGAALEAAFALQNRGLDSRLDRMQATLGEQRQLITSALLDLEEQVVVLLVQLAGQDVEEGQPGTADIAPVTDRWVINAGTYSNPERAAELKQRLLSMGYEARLGDGNAGSDIGHRVQVAGFADRAAAEAVARQIMEQTQLNGVVMERWLKSPVSQWTHWQ